MAVANTCAHCRTQKNGIATIVAAPLTDIAKNSEGKRGQSQVFRFVTGTTKRANIALAKQKGARTG